MSARKWLVIGLFGLLCSIQNAFADQSLDAIAAIVNKQVITTGQLAHQMQIARAQAEAAGVRLPSNDVFRKQVLNQMIDTDLQLQLAQKAGIVISDAQLTQAIQHIAAQNHLSVATLYQKISAHGMSIAEYKEEIRREMMVSAVQQQELMPHIKISHQEVEDLYNAIKARDEHASPQAQQASSPMALLHIIDVRLVRSPTQENVANQLLAQLRQGQDPSVLAKTNPAIQVNDLGWRHVNQLPSVFTKAAENLSVGQYSAPVLAPNGWHVLHLIAKRGGAANYAARTPVPSMQDVQQLVFQRKFGEALQNWLQKLRSESYVKVLIN